MKPVTLSRNLLSAVLFWACNKIPPRVLLAYFLEDLHWSGEWKVLLGQTPLQALWLVVRAEDHWPLSLREALLSWWPTMLPSLSACSQTQDGKPADPEKEGGGFRGFQTWHQASHVPTHTSDRLRQWPRAPKGHSSHQAFHPEVTGHVSSSCPGHCWPQDIITWWPLSALYNMWQWSWFSSPWAGSHHTNFHHIWHIIWHELALWVEGWAGCYREEEPVGTHFVVEMFVLGNKEDWGSLGTAS